MISNRPPPFGFALSHAEPLLQAALTPPSPHRTLPGFHPSQDPPHSAPLLDSRPLPTHSPRPAPARLPTGPPAVGAAQHSPPARAPPPANSAQAGCRAQAAARVSGWAGPSRARPPARTHPPPLSRTPRAPARAAAPLARPPYRRTFSSSRRPLSPAPQPRSRPQTPSATLRPPTSEAAVLTSTRTQSSPT